MPINNVKDLLNKVDTEALKTRSLTEWRPVLAEECGVYVFGESYLAKRFDSINYQFCDKDKAKEILIDNLYALLRYKYFTSSTEEIDNRIKEIVTSFTTNLKTTLKKSSFDINSDSNIMSLLPDGCIAFRNGVFNFVTNKWLFKYDVIKLEKLSNTMYLYDPKYVIFWYLDYNFDPFPININETSLSEFIDLMKELCKTNRNYCFELMYNISHDINNNFSFNKFKHLCEILGYNCLQSFSQHFVMLIGAGQNGKNSLFDGCFTNKLVPMAAANDLESIETDKFITGALENRSHNFFLEATTVAKTYSESKMLKALTGSMYQTIEPKGVPKYSGILNCKYMWSANDQDKLKFGDTTPGFRRRINMIEIYYQWDSQKSFLQKGDYYDTTFSDSLTELKNDVSNTTVFVYFAMYGMQLGTQNFTKNFKFDYNDWNMKYAEVDLDLKEKIELLTIEKISHYLKTAPGMAVGKNSFYDIKRNRLQLSPTVKMYGIMSFEDLIKMFENPEEYTSYFSENDIYMNIRIIQTLVAPLMTNTSFTQSFKKLYGLNQFEMLSSNIPHVKCTFKNGKLKILR